MSPKKMAKGLEQIPQKADAPKRKAEAAPKKKPRTTERSGEDPERLRLLEEQKARDDFDDNMERERREKNDLSDEDNRNWDQVEAGWDADARKDFEKAAGDEEMEEES